MMQSIQMLYLGRDSNVKLAVLTGITQAFILRALKFLTRSLLSFINMIFKSVFASFFYQLTSQRKINSYLTTKAVSPIEPF